MQNFVRHDVNEESSYSGIVEAGDIVFTSFCVGKVDLPIEAQVHGASDHVEARLAPIAYKGQ